VAVLPRAGHLDPTVPIAISVVLAVIGFVLARQRRRA
jgi:hypothetical protein